MIKTAAFSVLLVFLSVSPAKLNESAENFGNIIVDETLNVNPDLSFNCNISQWPPIIGKNIRVIISSVKPNPGTDPEKITDFLNQSLSTPDNQPIILLNIRRAETFSIIADVFVKGENLAKKLLNQELAVKSDPIETEAAKGLKIPFNNTENSKNAPNESSNQMKESFVGSKNSKVFHRKSCRFVSTISPKNLVRYMDKKDAKSRGKRPCRTCLP